MPNLTDIATRVAPYARQAVNDDDLRNHAQRAVTAVRGGRLRRRPAPKPTRLQRTGAALRASGAVVGSLGTVAEKRRRAHRRTAFLRATLLGGAGTAAAVALQRRNAAVADRTEPAPATVNGTVTATTTPQQTEVVNG